MQTLTTQHGTYKLSPTRDAGALQAKFAKCNGKYKPSTIKAERRVFPAFEPGMSTAEYVRGFEEMNRCAGRKLTNFYPTLNTDPCTLYSGEDRHEIIIECDVIEFPQPELLAA